MTLSTLVYLHGGAGIFGSPANLDARHRGLLEARGFTVVSADYPKVIGSSIHAMLAALEQTTTALAAESPTGRVVVMGHSFGGYLTLWLAATHPAVERAVALAGYGDLLAGWCREPSAHYLASKDLSGFLPHTVTPDASFEAKFDLYMYLRQTGSWPEFVSQGHVQSLAAISPLRLAVPPVPVFLAHGTADTDVPYTASVEYYDHIAATSTKSRLYLLPGGGHTSFWQMDDPEVAGLWEELATFCVGPD
jgi:pimeloyl-ACP methyl ester carboxylesterase